MKTIAIIKVFTVKFSLVAILLLLSLSPKRVNISEANNIKSEGDPDVKKCLSKADSMTIKLNAEIDSMLNEKNNYITKVNILEFRKSNKK